MKAIVVKFIPCTNTKGSRYKAFVEGSNSITVEIDHALPIEDMKAKAARALIAKMKWAPNNPTMVMGGLPNGDTVFCLVQDYVTVPTEL